MRDWGVHHGRRARVSNLLCFFSDFFVLVFLVLMFSLFTRPIFKLLVTIKGWGTEK